MRIKIIGLNFKCCWVVRVSGLHTHLSRYSVNDKIHKMHNVSSIQSYHIWPPYMLDQSQINKYMTGFQMAFIDIEQIKEQMANKIIIHK